MDFNDKAKKYITRFEEYLSGNMPKGNSFYPVCAESMSYAVSSGGKRVRPMMCMSFCDMLSGDSERSLGAALALELVHSYSLVHDDMPCMDDDDYRRGRESTHKKFGEANGLLCGDALLTYAFYILSSDERIDTETRCKCIQTLSEKAGINGMIGGQEIDLSSSGREISEEALLKMDELKTSKLLECAAVMGCIVAGKEQYIEFAESFGRNLGIAFQIVDDILDYLEGEDNSDIRQDKSTYVSMYTLDGARERADMYTRNALDSLDAFKRDGYDTSFLRQEAEMLLNRKK